jgi:hypothetical protein
LPLTSQIAGGQVGQRHTNSAKADAPRGSAAAADRSVKEVEEEHKEEDEEEDNEEGGTIPDEETIRCAAHFWSLCSLLQIIE